MFRLKYLFHLKDVVLAANDEQRNRKGTNQLSVLVKEVTVHSGYVFYLIPTTLAFNQTHCIITEEKLDEI